MPLVPVKDIAAPGANEAEDGGADVGAAIPPWPDDWRACVAAGAGVRVAVHDNPSDVDRFARVSALARRRLDQEASR